MRILTLFAAFLVVASLRADWGAPVAVRHIDETCVTYRAKLAGDTLVVEADIAEGWHTFAMDNELRAKEALAGKQSLGIDGPTQISLPPGVETAGPWMQTPPEDFSKPDLRWFSWGFEERAVFAVKLEPGSVPATVTVRGQACSETTCKNIDVELEAPKAPSQAAPAGLEPVRR